MPAALALSSAVGLLAALLGDGSWDILSWLALGVPIVVGLGYAAFGWTRRTDLRQ
jgi:hypothetical protein